MRIAVLLVALSVLAACANTPLPPPPPPPTDMAIGYVCLPDCPIGTHCTKNGCVVDGTPPSDMKLELICVPECPAGWRCVISGCVPEPADLR